MTQASSSKRHSMTRNQDGESQLRIYTIEGNPSQMRELIRSAGKQNTPKNVSLNGVAATKDEEDEDCIMLDPERSILIPLWRHRFHLFCDDENQFWDDIRSWVSELDSSVNLTPEDISTEFDPQNARPRSTRSVARPRDIEFNLGITRKSEAASSTSLAVRFYFSTETNPALYLIKSLMKSYKKNATCLWTLRLQKDELEGSSLSLEAEVKVVAQNQFDWNLGDPWSLFLQFVLEGNSLKGGKRWEYLKNLQKDSTALKGSQFTQDVTARNFYDVVHVPDKNEQVSDMVQVSELTTPLFPFQRRTVNWMMGREGVKIVDGEIVPRDEQLDLPAMVREYKDLAGKTIYANTSLGYISTNMTTTKEIHQVDLRGGVLAEEMGLGKTVELISLLSLHKRDIQPETIYDDFSDSDLKVSPATLIICPPAITQQWLDELKQHAPKLRVFFYEGTKELLVHIHAKQRNKATPKAKASSYRNHVYEIMYLPNKDLVEELMQYDIVLTTYPTLRGEIHYAEEVPERSLRTAKKYERRTCPLLQISWWRVCLDEAQMIENAVSSAAQVARLIPRINAWAVTGTPVQKNIDDLFGLLAFLRIAGWGDKKKLWQKLISSKHWFQQLFSRISLRHTKAIVSDEINLPAQNRAVISIPLSQVEDLNYQHLFEEACASFEFTTDGTPLEDGLDIKDLNLLRHMGILENMRSWLSRLRQTCVHPQVGGRNKKALGGIHGALRTVDEVLQVMIEQNDMNIKTDQRAMHMLLARRAQLILELQEDFQSAIPLLEIGLLEARKAIATFRKELSELVKPRENELLQKDIADGKNHEAEEVSRVVGDGSEQGEEGDFPKRNSNGDPGTPKNNEDNDEEETLVESKDTAADWRQSALRNRLRDALEVEHVFLFILGNAHYVQKNKAEEAHQEEDIVKGLESQELFYYEAAKTVRKELMADPEFTAQRLIDKVKRKAELQQFVEIPEMKLIELKGGLESAAALEEYQNLCESMDGQAEFLDNWREDLIGLLQEPLVDQEDDANGDELATAADKQEQGFIYIDLLRRAVADRVDGLSGVRNQIILSDELYEKDRDEARGIEIQQLKQKLMAERETVLIIRYHQGRGQNEDVALSKNLKAMVTDLRQNISRLKLRSERRAQMELLLAEGVLKHMQKSLKEQEKAVKDMESEVEFYTSVFNARIEFYRQLQAVSDLVLPLDLNKEMREYTSVKDLSKPRAKIKPNLKSADDLVEAWANDVKRFQDRLAQARSKATYLRNLKQADDDMDKTCIICQDEVTIGILTVCGHQFCRDCMNAWYHSHKTCPVCKKELKHVDMHPVTHIPTEITIVEETPHSTLNTGLISPTPTQSNEIYKSINNNTMNAIKNVAIKNSYGSKIDMMVRHLIWIRRNEGAKSVIFTQWKDALEVIKKALAENGVRFTTLLEKDGVDKFKRDPRIEAFLLFARSQASGLNLVEASHVFLCEPLINTGLELQAIARVHRIGQQRETKVWLYAIANSVEESILHFATERRLEMIGAVLNGSKTPAKNPSKGKGKQRAITVDDDEDDLELKIESANSKELSGAAANMVDTRPGGGEVVGDDQLWNCLFGVSRTVRAEADIETRRHLAASAAENRMATAVIGNTERDEDDGGDVLTFVSSISGISGAAGPSGWKRKLSASQGDASSSKRKR